mmetsp:Transcript_12358/g.19202  ORF Transcript_12358/g.19202 Transcript_12358/m.19202 type:complete len:194 (+) Transcript_12358:2244-2825(+)
MEYLNFTDIRFRISYLDKHSYGALEFNHPVNMTFITENFHQIFHVYIRNVTYVYHISPQVLDDFEILNTTADNMTINFRCKFQNPFLLGLLVKRSDKLYIHFRYDLVDTEGFIKDEHSFFKDMFIGNASLHRIYPEVCNKDKDEDDPLKTEYREQLYATKRINPQFDFRNDEMSYMRHFAVQCYYYLVSALVF